MHFPQHELLVHVVCGGRAFTVDLADRTQFRQHGSGDASRPRHVLRLTAPRPLWFWRIGAHTFQQYSAGDCIVLEAAYQRHWQHHGPDHVVLTSDAGPVRFVDMLQRDAMRRIVLAAHLPRPAE